jgi:protocatechuate 4,5-dioxygenase alpha chain
MTKAGENEGEIERTYVFNGALSRKGFRLNKFFYSLNKVENREAFKKDADALMDRFALTDWEKRKIHEKDWLALARDGGGNIFVMYKIGSVTGDSLQHIGAGFRGQSIEKFLERVVVEPQALIELSHHEYMVRGGAEAVEMIMWLGMRGALSDNVKLLHQNYYAPVLTGMGLLLLEDTVTPAI